MLITVFGKPASGKSTIITNIACDIAERGHKVGLLSADMSYSSLQLYFNQPESTGDNSIGVLFETRDFNNIDKYFLPAKGYKNIFVAGPHPGDPSHKYHAPSQEEVRLFFEKVRNYFKFVIIESTENINNCLAILSISDADFLINVMRPTMQGISYAMSHEHLINAIKPKAKILRAACNVTSASLAETMADLFSFEFDYIFNHDKTIQKSADSCIPAYYSVGGKQYKSFIREVHKLSDKLMEAEEKYEEL